MVLMKCHIRVEVSKFAQPVEVATQIKTQIVSHLIFFFFFCRVFLYFLGSSLLFFELYNTLLHGENQFNLFLNCFHYFIIILLLFFLKVSQCLHFSFDRFLSSQYFSKQKWLAVRLLDFGKIIITIILAIIESMII